MGNPETSADPDAVGGWYHTIDLPDGVTTPGFYDLRDVASRVLPADLSGKRCLDACSASGFWAFEMEKRGAAEAVALDVASHTDRDWRRPWLAPSSGDVQVQPFRVAKQALASSVERVEQSVYDVSVESLGTFDFVFIGSVLLHLRDPVRALRALRPVTGHELVSFEPILIAASVLHPRSPWGRMAGGDDARWWTPNAHAHKEWLAAAGFDVIDSSWHRQPFGKLHSRLPSRLPRSRAELRWWALDRPLGVLSQRLVARPNPGWTP